MHINLSTIQNFAAALVSWTVFSGLLIPYFVAFVTKAHWSSKIKQPVMLVSATALAVVTYLGTQGWHVHSWTDLFSAIGACILGAQAAYHKLWGKGDLLAAFSRLTDGKPKIRKKDIVKPAVLPDATSIVVSDGHLVKARKLGRKPPTNAPRVKLTADLVPAAAFTPPASVDYFTKVPASTWGMDGNDDLGDCTLAEVDHTTKARQVAAGNPEVKSTRSEVLAAYSAITGYNPDDPNSDQGAVMQDVRDYWRKHGITLGGKLDKITLFAAVDHTDLDLVRWCVDRFGAVALGINFPDSAMTQFDEGKPWDVVKGARIEGGHAISMLGYDTTYAYVITWGQVQKMTWAFFTKYVEEAWTDLSTDWISPAGEDPLGEVAYALGQQFEEVTGQANPFPAPQPQPDPTPTPSPDPTPTPAAVEVPAGLAKDVTLWARRVISRKDDSHQDKAVAQEWLAEVGG